MQGAARGGAEVGVGWCAWRGDPLLLKALACGRPLTSALHPRAPSAATASNGSIGPSAATDNPLSPSHIRRTFLGTPTFQVTSPYHHPTTNITHALEHF